MQRVLKRTGKIILLILGFIIFIIVAAFIFINTNYGKRVIKDKAVAYLENKFKTKVAVASLDFSLPKWIELKGVYLEDQKKDTLLYGGKIMIDFDMIRLLRGDTYIRKVVFENIYANIYRSANDTAFNFQFIVNAFSGNPQGNAIKDTAALKLTLKELYLSRVKINFKDDNAGNYFNTNIHALDATLNTFQPDKLRFGIDKINMDSVDFNMVTTKATVPGKIPVPDDNVLSLTLVRSDLRNVGVSVSDKVSGMYYANNVKHLLLGKGNIDVAHENITADYLGLDSSLIQFVAPRPVLGQQPDTAGSPVSWAIGLNQLNMHHNRFQFDDNAVTPKEGFDAAHIDLNNINIRANSIRYSVDSTSAAVDQLAFIDKSTFRIDSLHTRVLYNKTHISVLDLYLKTPQSLIQNTLEITSADIAKPGLDPQNSIVNVKLDNTAIAMNDLYILVPGLKNNIPPAQFRNNIIKLNTGITGNFKQLNIPYLQVTDLAGTRINGRAVLYNISDPKTLSYDLVLLDSKVNKDLVTSLVPVNSLPQSVNLPAEMLFSGKLKGDMNNLAADMKLGGSYGAVTLKGAINNIKNTAAIKYDVNITSNGFDAGKLLKQDSLFGKISLSLTAKGVGVDYKTMNADIRANVQNAVIKRYDYKNVGLNASLHNGIIKTQGTIDDPNIRVQYDISGNVKSKYPSAVVATLYIDTLRLKPLNLYKDSLDIASTIYLNAPNLDPKLLNMLLSVDSSRVTIHNKKYFFDSIIAKASTTDGRNVGSLLSPVIDLTASGNFEYDLIGKSLIQYIDSYYNITDKLPEHIADQQISVEGQLKKHPLVTDLVPGLTYEDIPFKGSYASHDGDSALHGNADIPYLQFKTNTIHNGKLAIGSANNKIAADIGFDKLDMGKNVLYASAIHAVVAGDSLDVDAGTKDVQNKDRFAFGAVVTKKDKDYVFSLKDNLLLDYQKWNVAAGNRISYSPAGILVNNFTLTNNEQRISANSTTGELNSPVNVAIESFQIKSLTSILNSDTLLADGLVNARFTISQFDKTLPAFTGNMELDSFRFMQQPVGTIKLVADKQDDNTINASADLSGNGNALTVKGKYYLNNEQQQFDADVNIGRLSMGTLQAFSQGNLERSSGSIRGSVALNGKFSDPRWKGTIGFDTARFSIAKLGTPYRIDGQKITLDYPTVSFDQFTIQDTASHSMSIDGEITAHSLTNYDVALEINANDFILVNSPKAINNQVYGFAAVNAEVSVSGNSSAPVIEGNISLNDATDVTLVLPESNISKDAANGVVRFIDRDTFDLPQHDKFSPATEPAKSFAEFLNYNLNIETSKKAALTIVIDPSTGDEIKVQGDANLNAGVDPGGNLVLAGNYELDKGYYMLHYQFLTRKFDLLSGSTIIFSGAPMDAQVDIKAEYIVNTPAKDLLGNEVGDVDPKLSNTFNQKIPFRVLLYLKGPMKKPEISFDIQLPDENTAINNELRTTIENKLSQLRDDVAATNKQVFSLLLLNRFAGEQSTDFFKGSGTDFNDLARESVSQFLSSALNQIASDLFTGIDINLNLNSYKDYTSADGEQRTDLNVAVTKNFLDDRLSITVGKNFGVEGQDAAAKTQQNNNSFLPDVTVNYKLTKDGKYMLKAYQKNQFEVILDGYVVETGVAFIVTLDYDRFKELFRRKKNK